MNAIVLSHGAAIEAHNRHLHLWRAYFNAVIMICPWDDPVPGGLCIGDSERAGRGTMERLLFAVTMASRFPCCAVMEYDTLLIGPLPTVEGGVLVGSALFHNQGDAFRAPLYSHSPWVATGETWWKLLTTGSDDHRGYPDRWLASAAHRAGVEMCSFDHGFSSDDKWDNDTIQRALFAKAEGCTVFHGVKTREAFDAIISSP